MIRTYIEGWTVLSPQIASKIAVLLAFCLLAPGQAGFARRGPVSEKFIFRSLVPTLEPLPAPKVLKGSVLEAVTAPPPPVNIFGYADQGSRYPTQVLYVAPNSVAWRAGLQSGDRILSGQVHDNRALLTVQRQGKKYSCYLNNEPVVAKLKSAAAKSDTEALSDYAIAMVVDNSASMGTRDCPGEISRWQWCQDHITELYNQQNGVLQRNISIITFDSNFHSRQNCSPQALKSVFADGTPSGETYMAPALEEAFLLVRSQLSAGRPAIVSVVSDGRPSDVESVKKAIIRETNVLAKPKLLTVVFIEVGTPERYLQELDNDLVKLGAAADIVKVIPFAEASTQGLSKTLASTIPKTPATVTTSLAGSASASVSTENRAREAINSHIFTYNPNAGTRHTLVIKARPIAPTRSTTTSTPPSVVKIKAHPSGTTAEAIAVPSKTKPVEVDEKAAALRGSANRTYK